MCPDDAVAVGWVLGVWIHVERPITIIAMKILGGKQNTGKAMSN